MPFIPYVKSLPGAKILFGLLLACTELLIPTPKTIAFCPKLPSGNKKVPFESNPIPYAVYLYLSMSLFLVSLTAPNKQFSKAVSKL